MAVQCLQIVEQKKADSPFVPVLKKVHRCLPEIVADPEFIASVSTYVFLSSHIVPLPAFCLSVHQNSLVSTFKDFSEDNSKLV